MPTLGAPLDLARYEARNFRAHILTTAPATPPAGMVYFNSTDSVLYWYDGTQWIAAGGAAVGGPPTGPASGDLTGNYPGPDIAAGVVTNTELAAGAAAANLGAAGGDLTGTYPSPTIGPNAVGAAEIANGSVTAAKVAADVATQAELDTAIAGIPAAPTSLPPNGAATGDLTGTYPAPQIAAGVIVHGDVNAANVNGAAGTPGLRSLGTTAGFAMAGNTTLNLVPGAAGDVDLNGNQLTDVGAPAAGTDAANKDYVDAIAQGISAKHSVRIGTTAQRALTGLAAIDGVTPIAGDRILVKNQTNRQENGIYTAAAGAWARATDSDAWDELVGAFVFIEEGGQADTGWVSQALAGGTIGTTLYDWVQFSAAGAYTAGDGLTLTGQDFDVNVGAGLNITADAVAVANNGITNAMIADGAIDLAGADVTGTLDIASGGTGGATAPAARAALGVPGKYSATFGGATTTTITAATHLLGAGRDKLVQVQVDSTGAVELPDVAVAANGDVAITYGVAPGAGTRRVTIIG